MANQGSQDFRCVISNLLICRGCQGVNVRVRLATTEEKISIPSEVIGPVPVGVGAAIPAITEHSVFSIAAVLRACQTRLKTYIVFSERAEHCHIEVERFAEVDAAASQPVKPRP